MTLEHTPQPNPRASGAVEELSQADITLGLRTKIDAIDFGSGVLELSGTWRKYLRMDDYVVEKAKEGGAQVLVYSVEGQEKVMAIKALNSEQLPGEKIGSLLSTAGLTVQSSSPYNVLVSTPSIREVEQTLRALTEATSTLSQQ